MTTLQSSALKESLSSVITEKLKTITDAELIALCIGNIIQTRSSLDQDAFKALVSGEQHASPKISARVNGVLGALSEKDSAYEDLRALTGSIAYRLSTEDVDGAVSDLMSVASGLEKATSEQLVELSSAQRTLARKVEFVAKHGGASLSQLNESQLFRLYQAGATHFSISNKEDRQVAVFFKGNVLDEQQQLVEVGRYQAHTQATEHDEGFVIETKLNSIDNVMAFPIQDMFINRSLIEKMTESLSIDMSPHEKAERFISHLRPLYNNRKNDGLGSGAIALYAHLSEQTSAGRALEACSTLGYIMHYANEQTSHDLSKTVSSIGLQLESDPTVTRGIINLAQKTSAQMIDAKVVFKRRDECVDAFQSQLNNPSLSVNEKVSLMSRTLHFAGGDIAQWVAHLIPWEPEASEKLHNTHQEPSTRISPRL